MKVEKFKVLLYLKRAGGQERQSPDHGTDHPQPHDGAVQPASYPVPPELWNARESRLNGKSRKAVETNEKIERLLLAVHSAFNSLMERKKDFDAAAVRDMFQGNAGIQMTLLKLLDRHNGGNEGPCWRRPCAHHTLDLPLHLPHAFRIHQGEVQGLGPGIRATQRAVHPRLSGFHPHGKRTCRGHASRLPGHPEKDLPYRLQGGTFGEIPFLPLQTTQTEGKYTESTQPGEFRETA